MDDFFLDVPNLSHDISEILVKLFSDGVLEESARVIDFLYLPLRGIDLSVKFEVGVEPHQVAHLPHEDNCKLVSPALFSGDERQNVG